MRSPSGPTVHFCANCDAAPSTSTAPSIWPNPFVQNDSPPTRINPSYVDEKSSVSSMSSATPSRTSTPPTEVSQAPSSPTFAPPVDMAEVLRRRQQSDMASAEIGRRMLKGWAMLADECPNPNCYGIPLVRPPKAGGEKDPRKVGDKRFSFIESQLCLRNALFVGRSTSTKRAPREFTLYLSNHHRDPALLQNALHCYPRLHRRQYQCRRSRQSPSLDLFCLPRFLLLKLIETISSGKIRFCL